MTQQADLLGNATIVSIILDSEVKSGMRVPAATAGCASRISPVEIGKQIEIHKGRNRKMYWLILILLIANVAQADVTRKVKNTVRFMGESEGSSVEYYVADRSADESTLQWTSGLMKTMSGGKETKSVTIVRLDKEVIWTLQPDDEAYTEMTFAEFREKMKKGMAQMEQAQAERDTTEVSEDMYEWKVEVLSEAEPKTIHGWPCRNVKLVATGTHKENPEDRVWITLDYWNSSDVSGAQEIRDFQMKYAKALGLDERMLTPGLMQAAGPYEKQFAALIEESKKAPGETVMSTIEIKRNQLVGPSTAAMARDAAASEITRKLPFGAKKEAKSEAPHWEERVKFRAMTELLEVTTGPVEASKFEIPTGYKKKQERGSSK
ncbi:MAG: hypothetical protein V1784_07875 [bacterium]